MSVGDEQIGVECPVGRKCAGFKILEVREGQRRIEYEGDCIIEKHAVVGQVTPDSDLVSSGSAGIEWRNERVGVGLTRIDGSIDRFCDDSASINLPLRPAPDLDC